MSEVEIFVLEMLKKEATNLSNIYNQRMNILNIEEDNNLSKESMAKIKRYEQILACEEYQKEVQSYLDSVKKLKELEKSNIDIVKLKQAVIDFINLTSTEKSLNEIKDEIFLHHKNQNFLSKRESMILYISIVFSIKIQKALKKEDDEIYEKYFNDKKFLMIDKLLDGVENEFIELFTTKGVISLPQKNLFQIKSYETYIRNQEEINNIDNKITEQKEKIERLQSKLFELNDDEVML